MHAIAKGTFTMPRLIVHGFTISLGGTLSCYSNFRCLTRGGSNTVIRPDKSTSGLAAR